MSLSVVVPTLNEEESLTPLVRRIDQALAGVDYEVILIDDNSEDDSWWVAHQLAQSYPVSFYLKRGYPGKAFSLLEGFSKAKYENICMIDADLQYPPEVIPTMLKLIKRDQADIVVANRIERNTSVVRQVASKGYGLIFNKVLHNFEQDVQSGLKVFRKEVLNQMRLSPTSWSFDLEFLIKARNAGYRIGGEDIIFAERQSGKSKVNLFKTTGQLVMSALALKIKSLSDGSNLSYSRMP